MARRRGTGPVRSKGGTQSTTGTIQNYFCKVGYLKDESNANKKRKMDEDDDVDDGTGMFENENDGGADGTMMEMDLTMKSDTTTTRGGPKSGRRKRLVQKAAKKLKLGTLITNYFQLEGRELPRELDDKGKIA